MSANSHCLLLTALSRATSSTEAIELERSLVSFPGRCQSTARGDCFFCCRRMGSAPILGRRRQRRPSPTNPPRNAEDRRSAAIRLRVLTKKTNLAATTAALADALHDPDEYVRLFATQSLGQFLSQLRRQPDTTPAEKKLLETHAEIAIGLLAGACRQIRPSRFASRQSRGWRRWALLDRLNRRPRWRRQWKMARSSGIWQQCARTTGCVKRPRHPR